MTIGECGNLRGCCHSSSIPQVGQLSSKIASTNYTRRQGVHCSELATCPSLYKLWRDDARGVAEDDSPNCARCSGTSPLTVGALELESVPELQEQCVLENRLKLYNVELIVKF